MRAFVRCSKTLIADQQGIVLYASLMLLALIMAVGVQAIVSTRSNFQISSNLRAENVAFYLSEAGIEWSKNELAHTTIHPPAPLSTLSTISSGTFSVATVSTVAVSPLLSRMVVRSTGNFASSSQIVQAELIKRYLLADAAIGFRGNANRAIFVGDLFSISGMDHDPATGKPIVRVRPYAGITVSHPGTKQRLESALEPIQLARISGTDRNGATIAQTGILSGEAIVRLAVSCVHQPTLNSRPFLRKLRSRWQIRSGVTDRCPSFGALKVTLVPVIRLPLPAIRQVPEYWWLEMPNLSSEARSGGRD
jgi:hypothetical protein